MRDSTWKKFRQIYKSAIIFLASKNFRHTFSDQKLAMKTDEIGESDNTIEILVSFGFQWSCPFLCTAVQGYLFCQWKSQTWGQKKTLTATSKQLFSVYLSLSVWYAWFAGTVKSIQSRWFIRNFRQLKNQFFEKKWKPGFDEISIMVILTASIRLLYIAGIFLLINNNQLLMLLGISRDF